MITSTTTTRRASRTSSSATPRAPKIVEDLEMPVRELQTEWIPDEGAWPSLTTRGVHGRPPRRPGPRPSCADTPGLASALLENGLQRAGEDVGRACALGQEAAQQARRSAGERRDRTQEVAGSSPASSILRPGQRRWAVGFALTRRTGVNGLRRPATARARWPWSLPRLRRPGRRAGSGLCGDRASQAGASD